MIVSANLHQGTWKVQLKMDPLVPKGLTLKKGGMGPRFGRDFNLGWGLGPLHRPKLNSGP